MTAIERDFRGFQKQIFEFRIFKNGLTVRDTSVKAVQTNEAEEKLKLKDGETFLLIRKTPAYKKW